MCWSCGCGELENDHGDSRSITTATLRRAGDAAGIDLQHVVANLVLSLAHFDPARAEKHSHREVLVGCEVFKSAEEKRYTLGVAYPVNRPDVAKAQDGFRDFAGAEVLEEAAWAFIRNGARIGLDHVRGTDGAGTVVESYIYRGPDWPQDNGYVVKSGDWLVGVLWEPPVWAEIKAGRKRGLSLMGPARRRRPSAEALASLRS
jgi:hypothetical protein